MKITSTSALNTIGQSPNTQNTNHIEHFRNNLPTFIQKNQETHSQFNEILEKYKQGESSEAVLELFVKQELKDVLNDLTPKLQDEITHAVHNFLKNDGSTLAIFERCLSGLC